MLDNEQTFRLLKRCVWKTSNLELLCLNGTVRFSKERKDAEDDEMTRPSGND
jgi:hypothetical protein